MALVDADITVEQQSVVVSPANTTASVSIEAVSNQFVISGAPGIRGPKGDIGLTGANVFIGEDRLANLLMGPSGLDRVPVFATYGTSIRMEANGSKTPVRWVLLARLDRRVLIRLGVPVLKLQT